MKTHFPQNRERLKNKLTIIHYYRSRKFPITMDIPKTKNIYFVTKRDEMNIILSMIIPFIIWIPIAYFTPYEDESSKILAIILTFAFFNYVRKFCTPILKLNKEGIFFRDFNAKWDEIDKRIRVRLNISNPSIEFIIPKNGKFYEKEIKGMNVLHFFEITEYVRAFKKKYRKPYIYNKNRTS